MSLMVKKEASAVITLVISYLIFVFTTGFFAKKINLLVVLISAVILVALKIVSVKMYKARM